MKNMFVNQISMAIVASIAAVSCYHQNAPENFNYLCTNVVTGIREHPESCDRYIQCNKFEAEVVVCPQGEVFSTELISCVEGNSTGCQEKDPETSAKCDDGFFGRLPYPGDCGKFYNCADGTAKLESCLDGYIFYEPLKFCLPGYENEGKCEVHSIG